MHVTGHVTLNTQLDRFFDSAGASWTPGLPFVTQQCMVNAELRVAKQQNTGDGVERSVVVAAFQFRETSVASVEISPPAVDAVVISLWLSSRDGSSSYVEKHSRKFRFSLSFFRREEGAWLTFGLPSRDSIRSSVHSSVPRREYNKFASLANGEEREDAKERGEETNSQKPYRNLELSGTICWMVIVEAFSVTVVTVVVVATEEEEEEEEEVGAVVAVVVGAVAAVPEAVEAAAAAAAAAAVAAAAIATAAATEFFSLLFRTYS